MPYDAITFDTQTIINNGYAFDDGALENLKDLKDHVIRVVVSDVVRLEILKHTRNHLKSLADKLHDSTRKAIEHKVFEGPAVDAMSREAVRELAIARVGTYLDDLGCEILSHEGIPLGDVMARYFSAQPPFSQSGAKKNEFPDAVTLITLDNWAEHHNFRVLAISGDKDWTNFAEGNERIDVVETIPDALDIINVQAVEAKQAAIAALTAIGVNANPNRTEEVQELLSNALERETPYVDCNSDVEVDAENATLSLVSFEFLDVEDLKLVRSHGSEVTVEVVAVIEVDARAPLYFSVQDSIDGDYVSIGGSEEHVRTAVEANLLISMAFDGAEFTVDDVDITRFPKSIDFGYVEFNSGNDFYGD